MAFRTEFPFVLPRGYVDPSTGTVYKNGVMRLATAKDEIVPLQDYRVQSNRAYLVILLLSRVIVRLGDLRQIDTDVIENLFSADLAYLQEFYRKVNEEGSAKVHAACPACKTEFDIDMVTGQVVGGAPGGGAEDGGEGRQGLG
jgi:hypothetical protein